MTEQPESASQKPQIPERAQPASSSSPASDVSAPSEGVTPAGGVTRDESSVRDAGGATNADSVSNVDVSSVDVSNVDVSNVDDSASASSSPGSSMSEIDREVAEAMSGMAAEDLAAMTGGPAVPSASDLETLSPGSELTGTVVGVSGDDVFLEFGAKEQGVVPRSQFGKKEPLEAGRRVDVTVERYDAETGLLVVNRKGSVQRATWANLSVGMLVKGRVTGLIRGGLELDMKGIRAFMPASQADIVQMKDVSTLLNEMVTCEVVELDRRGKNVIVSRRKAMEKELAENREKLQAELAVGQTRMGVVRRIADFGAFVDLGGIDGLLHIRELSWGTVDKVTDVVKEGDTVEVKVLKLDKKRGRISLGLRQTLPDPWVGVSDRYAEGTTAKVKVVRLADFGAFAELEPGVEALIPISEMGWSRVKSAAEVVSVGDMVDCKIIRIESDKRRIAVSMKQALADPWGGVLESFEANSIVKGKVTRLADFGAFVELTPGVEGLVHISELSDQRVKTCGDVVQVGQEVETRVLGVDSEKRRISLSIRQVAAPDEGGGEVAAVAEEPRKPKKRKKPLRGGLTFDW